MKNNLENKTEGIKKSKSGSIFWKGVLALVPGSIGSKYIVKKAGLSTELKDWTNHQKLIYNPFLLPLAIGTSLIVYIFSSINFGAPMFSKEWNQNRKDHLKQKEIQQELKTQNTYRNQFQTLDKNKDYIIDSTEFIYRK